MAKAEQVTDAMVAPAYATLTADERAELRRRPPRALGPESPGAIRSARGC